MSLPIDPYKGVRDFYPDDMAIQRYIFDTWSQTAESFGYERYDASVLEPSALYKAKGAENEEMVNDQTYTFIDRGDREVTLRPEMTPTVARMIAAKHRELAFPVRWYSIPNLFRYERTQRGRLREHWQLNCDIFGADDYTADVEIIALAYQTLVDFGADESMFEIRVNDRNEMTEFYKVCGVADTETQNKITRLNDRYRKISTDEYKTGLLELVDQKQTDAIFGFVSGETKDPHDNKILEGLTELGIKNVVVDRSLARGFDYYTGTIFEIFDTSEDNNRSLLGGGRYDNLTSLFGGEPVSGIGFGMGDVTMRDFLETHNLLNAGITSPDIIIMPMDAEYNLEAQKLAQQFRIAGISTSVDISTRKIAKKLSSAGESLVMFALVLGEDELKNNSYTLKSLQEEKDISGTIDEILSQLQN